MTIAHTDVPQVPETGKFIVFNKIVIIKSLEPEEHDSASQLAGYIKSQLDDNTLEIDVEIVDCESASQFIEIISQLTQRAINNGERPILHIECHGDQKAGLEFANGSDLSWSKISSILTSLNHATNFNLFVILAACFGFHFLGRLSPIKAAPCWGMVGPTEKVDSGEIVRGFMIFYRTLFSSSNLSLALKSLQSDKLEHSSWFAQIAETWFLRICEDYIRNHCSITKTTERAKELKKAILRDSGQRVWIKQVEAKIRFHNTHDLLETYFDSYFMIDKIQENKQRFRSTHQLLQDMITEMRSSKKYALSAYSPAMKLN